MKLKLVPFESESCYFLRETTVLVITTNSLYSFYFTGTKSIYTKSCKYTVNKFTHFRMSRIKHTNILTPKSSRIYLIMCKSHLVHGAPKSQFSLKSDHLIWDFSNTKSCDFYRMTSDQKKAMLTKPSCATMNITDSWYFCSFIIYQTFTSCSMPQCLYNYML